MSDNKNIFLTEESLIAELNGLYRSFGFQKYKMSKFEEYELYIDNKSFINSENIITFNEKGRLLALKPDVTLSIVKTSLSNENTALKCYYNENVYRPDSNGNIKEIMQIGLEHVGGCDAYSDAEIILLALKSLSKISPDYILEFSHLGLVSAILDFCNINEDNKPEILGCIEKKSTDLLRKTANELCLDEKRTNALLALTELYGSVESVLSRISVLEVSEQASLAISEIKDIYKMVKAFGEEQNTIIDFSVINDMQYYNNIIFKGYIKNIACGVLSGGRYDNLLLKYKSDRKACGFAIYMDQLETLFANNTEEAAIVILYNNESNKEMLCKAVAENTSKGKTVQTVYSELLDTNIDLEYNEIYILDSSKLRRITND